MMFYDIILKRSEFMKKKYSKAIRKIAEQKGVSAKEVYEDIQEAISAAYNNPDPAIQAHWRRIAPDGEMPTPEKFLEIMTEKIKESLK